jgi:hypothetical protein
MEPELVMMMEVLAIMFIPSFIINACSWIFIIKYMDRKNKKFRDDVVKLMSDLEAMKNKHGKKDCDHKKVKVDN